MSKLLALIVAALFAAASVTAVAQDKKMEKKPMTEKSMKKEPTAAQKKQQERMKECNAQAADKGLKGGERKKFMSSCLKPAAKKGEAKMMKKAEKK
jgi:Ni/Co efflux regulator RcnB